MGEIKNYTTTAIYHCSETIHHFIGDVLIGCLLKPVSFLELTVPPLGSDLVTFPVTTNTQFALFPRNQEGSESDTAVKSWEGEFLSVDEFLKDRKQQDIPMPAVSPVHTACTMQCVVTVQPA